jgi:putative endonuclease
VAREYRYYVYIMQSSSCRCIYIGITNDLHRRVFEHKMHRMEGFTDQYNATRLVYWERYDDVHLAISREKQLKGWRREKKMWLIQRFNPGWKDLAAGWYETQCLFGIREQGSLKQSPASRQVGFIDGVRRR